MDGNKRNLDLERLLRDGERMSEVEMVMRKVIAELMIAHPVTKQPIGIPTAVMGIHNDIMAALKRVMRAAVREVVQEELAPLRELLALVALQSGTITREEYERDWRPPEVKPSGDQQ